jgi:hypothetical protein
MQLNKSLLLWNLVRCSVPTIHEERVHPVSTLQNPINQRKHVKSTTNISLVM